MVGTKFERVGLDFLHSEIASRLQAQPTSAAGTTMIFISPSPMDGWNGRDGTHLNACDRQQAMNWAVASHRSGITPFASIT